MTGDTDVVAVSPLLFTVLVMMNLIGAVDVTCFFWAICRGIIQDKLYKYCKDL